ncbi:MAG: POTRA domain-containing protein [Bryobacteraceae bacterium]
MALVVCLAGALGAQIAPGRLYGKRISEILFEPARQPLTRDQIGLALQIRPGDVLEETSLSRAISRLWATGRFSDIAVRAEEKDGGVELVFETKPAFFVSLVAADPVPEPPNVAQLVNSTRLSLGDPFDESLLPEAAASLRELLQANGYYGARISYETILRPETGEADIRFHIVPGRRARLARPEFEGTLLKRERSLIRRSGWQRWFGLRGWQELTAARLQRGIERIQDAYRNDGYLRSNVRLLELRFDADKVTAAPRIQVEPGPRVRVRIEGARVRQGELQRLLPIYQERAVDRELLMEGQRNLEQRFRSGGYFDARVSFQAPDPGPSGEQLIVYRVNRGPRYRLAAVEFRGNRYFSDETLRERLSIIPARFPRYRNGRFSPEMLENDRAAIEALYVSNGFRDVVVRTRIEHNWRNKASDIAARFEIIEGPQYLVESVELAGVDLRLYDFILSLLSCSPGQPYSAANVAADRDAVLAWYFNNGYPEAAFDATVVPSPSSPHRMILRYQVREGRRNFVRDVLVRGLESTNPGLVRNRITVRPGEPLSQSDMVETQRRLYDLGIFAKVDIAVQNPEGRERNKYVLLQLEEARKYSLTLGFGAEMGRIGSGNNFDAPAGAAGFAPRGLLGITRSNIFGLAHTASALLRVSNIQQRLLLTYLAPQFFGNENINLTFSSLLDQSRDIRTFTSRRNESAIQIGQRLSRSLNLQYRVISRFVFIDEDTLKIDPNLIPVFSQPVKTIAFSASLIQDRRDDPVESRRGIATTLDFGFAPSFARTSTHYTRLVARNSTYHPVKREVIFARNTSFGWLYNLSDRPVPLPENFYAGGASTHRGFPDNQAGPRDLVTGFPIGGKAFLFFQHELRFPLIGNSVGGVLFHDMGNVYSSLDNLSFRFSQRDRQDFDYMVQAAGLGFRVRTPVGPLRVDFAFAGNSPRFVGFEGTRDELLRGQGRFNVPQRVSQFQWHFSIGQTF